VIDSKETPVLLILFNRVSISNELLKSLREAKPKTIYIFFDGPRNQQKHSDQSSIKLIEQDINEIIDWECDLFIKRNKNNVGSHVGPKQAIDWLFSKEERGIILEDDCIPNNSFFEYCSVLLDRYSEDDRVFMISGDNGGPIINQDFFNKNSYLFTKVPLTWGWATWKNRWENFDGDLSLWNQPFRKIRKLFDGYSLFESYLLYKMLNRVSSREEKNWDYMLYSTMIKNKYLSIIPRLNLIKNIGWGYEATHTKKRNFRSDAKTFQLTNLSDFNDDDNTYNTDVRISYAVHFGINDKQIYPNVLLLTRIIYLSKRAIYWSNVILKNLFKLRN
jgi:hypothetical protein